MEIHSETIPEAWEESMRALITDRSPLIYTQRGERAKEIQGMLLTIENPMSQQNLPVNYAFGDIFIEEYCKNILNASSGEHTVYSRIVRSKKLGERGNNQISRVVSLLKKEPNSRRAIIGLWDAEKDMQSQHPPCICTIQFMIRQNRLETLTYCRSNDSWMAALPDMIAIMMLSEIISDKLSIKVGRYFHFAASYHLYECDIVPATIALAV